MKASTIASLPESINPSAAAESRTDSMPDVGQLWDRMMLSTPTIDDDGSTVLPVPSELRPVLRLFDAASAGSLHGGLSTPSAGALYPYEGYAIISGPDGPVLYLIDVARRTCRLVAGGPAVGRCLQRSGIGMPGDGDALVLTVVRPWLSMRKYGHRGYLYAQLDAAHLATHLLCLASQTYEKAFLHTRLQRRQLDEFIGLDTTYRFIHSVLSLGGATPRDAGVETGPWTCAAATYRQVGADLSSRLERECWQSLAGFTHSRSRDAGTLTSPESLRSGPRFPGAGPVTDLAARRRSTKDFSPQAIAPSALEETLAVLRSPVAIDLPADIDVRATLLARRVADRPSYRLPLSSRGEAAAAVPLRLGDEDLVRACMGQEHLRNAAALVVFHLPRRMLLHHGPRGVDDNLLRAGALAHLLYLGATAKNIAITSIGGFDASRWRDIAGLGDDDEILYIVLLGTPGIAPVKLDRLQPAYAHNER